MSASICDFTFLKGVKVVDFSQFEAGPSCTQALAWLGAEVVKVENPNGRARPASLPRPPDTDPFYFLEFNANKRSITVDLKSHQGAGARQGHDPQGGRDDREHGAGRDRADGPVL